jgi:hypothetical protein
MTLPVVSDSVQFFDRCGCVPTAGIVVAHYHHRLDLMVFPRAGFAHHEYGVLFVPEGEAPPRDEGYCAFAPKPVLHGPGNISVNVT